MYDMIDRSILNCRRDQCVLFKKIPWFCSTHISKNSVFKQFIMNIIATPSVQKVEMLNHVIIFTIRLAINNSKNACKIPLRTVTSNFILLSYPSRRITRFMHASTHDGLYLFVLNSFNCLYQISWQIATGACVEKQILKSLKRHASNIARWRFFLFATTARARNDCNCRNHRMSSIDNEKS